jgi:hypothetical protein
MNLKAPFFISSRLLPSVRVADAVIGIEVVGKDAGRLRYRHTIDFDGRRKPHVETTIRSGVGNGSVRGGMTALLSFLYAASEGGDMRGEFPPRVEEWAKANADEIGIVLHEIESDPDCCVEG